MSNIKIVKSTVQAKMVVDFLCSIEAFNLEMNDFRVKARKEAVLRSLKNSNCRYWYVKNKNNKVIAAIGEAENERENGGYYLDYFAVRKSSRRRGLGSSLLGEAEKYVRQRGGRFILIDTGDTKEFLAARKFYLKNGYFQVGHIPEYYDVNDGRIDYYKKISN